MCIVLRCTRSTSPINYDYNLNDETLQVTEQHQYLGLIFHESMQWLHHIQAMCIKANRSLNFLRRNLSKYSSNVKQNAYTIPL